MAKSHRSIVALAAVLSLVAGCGDDGGGGGGVGLAPAPAGAAPSLFEHAALAGSAVGQATDAAIEAILFKGTGVTPTGPAGSPSQTFQSPAVSFDFTFNLDFTIDLDAEDAAGNDRFPNATGMIDVTASGAVEGTTEAGQATYAVMVTAATDLVFTNPENGATATIPEGSSWSHTLTIEWSRTDAMNWSVTATSDFAVELDGMTVVDGDTTYTVSAEGSRQVVWTLARVDGEVAQTRTVEGSLTITISDGVNTETITIGS